MADKKTSPPVVIIRRKSLRVIGHIEEPILTIFEKVVDFEGHPLMFTIILPIDTRALPANIVIGQTKLTNLINYNKCEQGYLYMDVEVILDQSMNGYICAFVDYVDDCDIIRNARLYADIEVIPRQHIDETTIQRKGRIGHSFSEPFLPQLGKPERKKLNERSLTIEEHKDSLRYRSYQQRLKADGIFIRPRSAEPMLGRLSTLVLTTEVSQGVFDFCTPVKRSATNNLLKVNHLNGVPAPYRQAISLNSSPAHSIQNRLFARCPHYRREPPAEVVPEVQTPGSIVKWRSEEQFPPMPMCPPNTPITEQVNEVPLEKKINIIRQELTKVIETSNELYYRAWLWWFSVKRSYANFSQGMMRMNRRDFF